MMHKLFPAIVYKGETRIRPLRFVSLLLQVLGIFAVVYCYGFEQGSGVAKVLPWLAGGFIVHSLIAVRYRQAVFVLLTIAALLFLLGPVIGSMVTLTLLTMVGVAHLRTRFSIRVALVCLLGAALVLLREQIVYAPRLIAMAAIAGTFLMFRFILYIYELKHEKSKPTAWQRLAYFFMLPNLCFPLFPIVDYKTFVQEQYAEDADIIIHDAIRKMLRGVLQLLAYRVVYLYLTPSPVFLYGPVDSLHYIVTAYLAVLRLSGLFHFAAGTLQLFGYKLPPVFNNFFILRSFTEIWRRTNIYWKDFVTKIFFYPLWFRLRKVKGINALFISGMITFVLTWQLHAWQWFWVLGHYRLSFVDFSYWIILGAFITINTLYESKNPPAKIPDNKWQFSRSVVLVLRILGVNLFMAVLWSYWVSPGSESLLYLFSHFTEGGLQEWLLLSAVIISAVLIGTGVHYFVFQTKFDVDFRLGNKAQLVTVAGISALLIAFALPQVKAQLSERTQHFVQSLQEQQLNSYDKENAEQGYYEKLLRDPDRDNPWEVHIENRNGREGSDAMVVQTDNILQRRLKPSSVTQVENNVVTVNQWGMRDKEYTLEKPARTFRIALLGGSYEMGVGVNDSETYQSLIEDQLNAALIANDTIDHIEILNFSAGGYHLLQHVWMCDHEVFRFQPDMVLYIAHSEDPRRLNGFFSSLIQNGVNLEYPELRNIKTQSGATQGMSSEEIKKRLMPWNDSVFRWGYSRITGLCREHHAEPVWLFLQATADEPNEAETMQQLSLAAAAGFVTIRTANPYPADVHTVQVSSSDSHPNALGHQLIANTIFTTLTDGDSGVLRKLHFRNK